MSSFLLGGIAVSDCDRWYRKVICPSVRPSVTQEYPAKAVGRNKLPFDWDTRLVPNNIVSDRGPGPLREGEI